MSFLIHTGSYLLQQRRINMNIIIEHKKTKFFWYINTQFNTNEYSEQTKEMLK